MNKGYISSGLSIIFFRNSIILAVVVMLDQGKLHRDLDFENGRKSITFFFILVLAV